MNANVITRTLNTLKNDSGIESLGFKRYAALPKDVKFNLKVAHLFETGSTNAHDRIVNFFQNMTEQEYINWMKFNAK
jgi:hypothetical protein